MILFRYGSEPKDLKDMVEKISGMADNGEELAYMVLDWYYEVTEDDDSYYLNPNSRKFALEKANKSISELEDEISDLEMNIDLLVDENYEFSDTVDALKEKIEDLEGD